MFTAELFTIAKTLKQPKCPSPEEWIKKMWYTHTHTHTHIYIVKILLYVDKNFTSSRFNLIILLKKM